jgi:hypothetical protein
MNQDYFAKFSDMAKKVQEPLQAMAELNVKTFQDMSSMRPEQLTNIKKPEDFLEKQIELAVTNGRKALDYLEKSFEIFEKTMLSLAQETKSKTDGKKL